MGLIVCDGSARSDTVEAVVAVRSRDSELADRKIIGAKESLVHAHHSQTGMLTEEIKGDNMQVALLAVYNQDRLMVVIAFTDLAKEVIDLYCHIGNE